MEQKQEQDNKNTTHNAPDPTHDYYNILGLRADATPEEIREAYKQKVIKYHPRRFEQELNEAEETFNDVAEAYRVLSDKTQRKAFDDFLDNQDKNKEHIRIAYFNPYMFFLDNLNRGFFSDSDTGFLGNPLESVGRNEAFHRDEFFRHPPRQQAQQSQQAPASQGKTDEKKDVKPEEKKEEKREEIKQEKKDDKQSVSDASHIAAHGSPMTQPQPNPDKFIYHSKSITKHTVFENGKMKTVTHKVVDDNGQVHEEKQEEEVDEKGNVQRRILPTQPQQPQLHHDDRKVQNAASNPADVKDNKDLHQHVELDQKTLNQRRASDFEEREHRLRTENDYAKQKHDDHTSKDQHAKEETKKEEPKKEEAKKEEAKKEEPKHDEPKKEEPKHDEPKKEEPKHDEPKKEEAK